MISQLSNHILSFKSSLNRLAEVGWDEVNTTAFIKETISDPSLIEGIGKKKVGAVFSLGGGSKKIFVRVDIDALPTAHGAKHLCGHSSHAAALLGAYFWLKKKEAALTRRGKQVLFIFQPAEETYPSGALTLLQAYPKLFSDSVYGVGAHVQPKLPLGTVRISPGVVYGAGDYMEVAVLGKQVHVKDVLNGVDAMEGAMLVMSAFREFKKTFPQYGTAVVFNLNTIQGGTAANCIPDSVKMTGDIRWHSPSDQQKIKDFCRSLPHRLTSQYKGTINVTYYDGYPPVVNDAAVTTKLSQYFQTHSTLHVVTEPHTTLAIEDFAFYTKNTPCAFADVGVGGAYDLHEANFTVSDKATVALFLFWQKILTQWLEV